MTATPKQYSVEEVEKIARIEIPDAASEIQVDADTGWMDDAAWIKFALSPDEMKPFIEKYGFQLEEGYWSIQNTGLIWWPDWSPPSKPPIAKYMGAKRHFTGYSQSILVDVTNPDLYVVYFQCIEH